jgi:hypothetical protein
MPADTSNQTNCLKEVIAINVDENTEDGLQFLEDGKAAPSRSANGSETVMKRG